jgi:hypothetical protein
MVCYPKPLIMEMSENAVVFNDTKVSQDMKALQPIQ